MGRSRMLTLEQTLPDDGWSGALAARVWNPAAGGPCVAAVSADGLIDMTSVEIPTMSDLCEMPDAVQRVQTASGPVIATLDEVLANTPESTRNAKKPWLLAPIDLQAVKAAGVTFPRSMIERVIEEQAQGAPEKAEVIRAEIANQLGGDLRNLVPGSAEAMALKQTLIAHQAWSQYLEVGIGEDAEIFTKAQPMSAVGHGMLAGLHPRSTWNNPEPEIVLVVASNGRIIGATLGNDVNLRDFEGRSALLLSKAKDNNASASVGPFIRFFDDTFVLDDIRRTKVHLTVSGDDDFVLEGASSMMEIARDPAALVGEMIGRTHQYPDGAVLFLGTMFAPTEDRDDAGMGFTHKPGDIVTVAARELGRLTNKMTTSDAAPPWTFGLSKLMRNLGARGLLSASR